MSAPMDIPQRPPPRVAVEDVSEHGSPSLSRSPPEDPLADVRIRAALASASPSSFSAFLHPSSSSPSRSYSHSRSHSHSRTRPPESPAPFGSPLPAGGRPSDPADEGRGRRHRSGASALLTVVLTEAERKTEHLRALLRIAEERADAAVHRAEAAEARAMRAEEAARRAETSLRRSEEAREDAEEAIGEAKRAKEECVKAEARAMALERDNRRLERENDRLERERSRAEAREKEALDASRRWQNQVEDEKAWGENMMKKRWEDGREVGFKQGYQDGRDAGYDEGREDTEAAYGRGVDTYDEPHAHQGVPIVSLPSERHERIRAWAASADESMRSFSSPKPQPRPIWLRRRIQTEPQISGNYH